MGPKRTVALVVGVLGAMVAMAPPAFACKRVAPGVCEESGNIDLPGNSDGAQVVSDLPAKTKNALIAIDGSLPDRSLAGLYYTLSASKPTLKARVLYCVGAYSGTEDSAGFQEFTLNDSSLQVLFLSMCLHLAVQITRNHHPVAGGAAAGCRAHNVAVGLTVKRVGGRYVAHVSGTPFTPRRGPALSVSCRPHGRGVQLSVHPTARGRTLRQAVGPRLALGFVNPTSTSVGLHVSYRASQ